jgi:NitT/TauT family transport system ATP-binding protein
MSEKTPASLRTRAAQMMPNMRGAHVISLVDITASLGQSTNLTKLATKLGNDISILLPVLEAAEILGLLTRQNEEIALTDFGVKFQKVAKASAKIPLLKDQLTKIEPFKTTLELLSRQGRVRTRDIANALSRMNVRWDLKPELNESIIHGILIGWGTFAKLFSHDGKTEEFRIAR